MSSKHDQPESVPEWMVERLAGGDLPAAKAREIEQRLEREPDGRARLGRIVDSNAELLNMHPPAAMAEAIRQRAQAADRRAAARPRRSPWLMIVPILAVGATALVAATREGPQPMGYDERLKGATAPGLHVYRRAGKTVQQLADGAGVHAGDELQLAYVARGNRYGAVLSLDGAGRVTYHLPEGGGPAAALRANGEVTLPQSYQLDAAPRFERFLIVAGNVPFDTGVLADVLRGAAKPPAGTESSTFTVRKE